MGQEFFKGLDKNGVKQAVFAPEIIVQQGFIDASFICYFLHPGAFFPLFDEHFSRGIQDRLFGLCLFFQYLTFWFYQMI
jgi:hypothetical protein